MGLSSDEAYETLREIYNNDIEDKQNKNRKNKRIEKKDKTIASKKITKFLKTNKYFLKPNEQAFKNYFKYTIPKEVNTNFIDTKMLLRRFLDIKEGLTKLPINIFIEAMDNAYQYLYPIVKKYLKTLKLIRTYIVITFKC
jgi:hypothetical protein